MLSVLIILLLIICNGFFALSEIALISTKEGSLPAQDNKRADKTRALLKKPQEFLSAIQVGVTLINLIEGVFGGEAIAKYLAPVFTYFKLSDSLANNLALVVSIGLITYVSIVIGELIPKSIAISAPAKVALFVTPFISIFTKITYPFVRLLTATTQTLLKLFKVDNQEKELVTEADIKRILNDAFKQGNMEKSELELHNNVFSFNDVTAEQIMTPADKIISISTAFTRPAIADLLKAHAHSHFPFIKTI